MKRSSKMKYRAMFSSKSLSGSKSVTRSRSLDWAEDWMKSQSGSECVASLGSKSGIYHCGISGAGKRSWYWSWSGKLID